MDLQSYTKWYDYARARDDMLRETHSGWAPWNVVYTDDKKRGRLNLITHLLGLVPYTPLEPRSVTLPERPGPDGYVEPDLSSYTVPTVF
jgi:hypothetical protein